MSYIPNRGDIIWIDFDPQLGKEIQKRRPALVLSQRLYNEKTSLCIVCPLTSTIKGYPFEVIIKEKKQASAILADQVKSFDWRRRNAKKKGKANKAIVDDVIQKLGAIIL